MAARTEYELSVQYGGGQDEDVDTLATRFGFERIASGGGPGGRDLHYQRDTRPAEPEIQEIIAALKALPFLVWAAIEVWVYDENDEIVQDESGGNEVIDLVDEEEAA